jgi:hypothetical protein
VRDLVDGVVIGNQKALEAQLLLEDFGEQPFAAGDLDAIPTAIPKF